MSSEQHSPSTLRKKLEKVDRMLLDLLNENGYEKAQSNKKYITLEKKKNEYETALKDAESSVDAAKKQARSAVERRILENAERRKNEALQRKLAEKEKAVGGGGAGGRRGGIPKKNNSMLSPTPKEDCSKYTYDVLKKKIEKVDSLLLELEEEKGSKDAAMETKKYKMLQKKREEYMESIQQKPEYKQENMRTAVSDSASPPPLAAADAEDTSKKEEEPVTTTETSTAEATTETYTGLGPPPPVLSSSKSTYSSLPSQVYSYEVLQKKLDKAHNMMQEILDEKGITAGPRSKKYQLLEKKREEYQMQIELTDEWKEEQKAKKRVSARVSQSGWAKVSADDAMKREREEAEARRKEEEEEKERKRREREAEEEERKRRQAEKEAKEEEERKQRQAEKEAKEEEERRRRQEEREAEARAAADREASEEQAKLDAQEERRRQARMLLEERKKEKEREEQEAKERAEREKEERAARLERERIEEEERRERARIEAEERAIREAKEAEERAIREAQEAEERARREAEEAEERARQEEAEAEERARREAAEAEERERREKEEAEKAEQERIEREKAEAAAAERRAWEEANAEERARLEKEAVEAEIRRQKEAQAAAGGPEQRMSIAEDSNKGMEPMGLVNRNLLQEPYSENVKKLLRELDAVEARQRKLEQQLKQNGIPISEDIPYEVAKDKIAEITEKMKALATSDEDPKKVQFQYFKLEEEMAKFTTAMMLTDEFAEEQERLERKWDSEVQADNIAALRKLRRHMPVQVRNMGEETLTTTPTPNGKTLPLPIARRFKRTNVLQLIRVDPDAIEKMHPSLLEGLRSTGLTLTERRALHEHLKNVGNKWQAMTADKTVERKWAWYQSLKLKVKEMITEYDRHVEQYGPPGNHPYQSRKDPGAGGCPLLGNQCPLKADNVVDYSDDFGYTPEAEYETNEEAAKSEYGGGTTPTKRTTTPTKAKSTLKQGNASNEAIMKTLKERSGVTEPLDDVEQRLLRELFHGEKRSKTLEKQLTQNGITVAEDDIPYAVAKAKVEELTEEIKKVAGSMATAADPKEMMQLETQYVKLSQDLEKYTAAMTITKEWAAEQRQKEKQWEDSVLADNIAALQKIRRHMPVNIRELSEKKLSSQQTPNGKVLPTPIAKKFMRTNILQLLRTQPRDIEPMHPSSLEALRTTGLTLTERRALYEHLKDLGPKWKAATSDKMLERKWMWHESLKSKFKELVQKYDDHVKQYGPPGNHPYASRKDPSAGGCPLLGNQCPVKADLALDYSGDYGYPSGAEFISEKVQKHNLLSLEEYQAMRESDDEWGEEEEEEPEPQQPARPVMGGLLSAIAGRGR